MSISLAIIQNYLFFCITYQGVISLIVIIFLLNIIRCFCHLLSHEIIISIKYIKRRPKRFRYKILNKINVKNKYKFMEGLKVFQRCKYKTLLTLYIKIQE